MGVLVMVFPCGCSAAPGAAASANPPNGYLAMLAEMKTVW